MHGLTLKVLVTQQVVVTSAICGTALMMQPWLTTLGQLMVLQSQSVLKTHVSAYGRCGFGNATNSGGNDGRANFYAGFNWSAGIATLAGSAYFDSLATEYGATSTTALVAGDTDGGWAYKVSLGLDLTQWIPGGSLWGMYMADGDEDTDYVQNAITPG